jgi:hypothetical protein
MIKLRILARAETMIARAKGRRLGKRATLVALAVGLILITVTMITMGVYHWLAAAHGPVTAAFAVAGLDAVLAAILLYVASRLSPGPEEQMVSEVRDLAMAELSADVEGVKDDFNHLTDDVKRIRSGFAAITGGGPATGLLSIGPVLSLLTDTLKRHKPKSSKKK